MEGCVDLVAQAAVYHASCMAEFRLNEETRRPTAGRPADKEMAEAFENFMTILKTPWIAKSIPLKNFPKKC